MAEWRYAKLTWPEVRQAARDGKAILLPVAAIEQHGPHLPIDTDNVAALAVCERAAQADPNSLLCAPPIHYGFNEHNMDFPGTISVQAQHFIDYCYDVAVSFARHGFPLILFVNGHASNDPLLQVAARLATLHAQAACALVSYWDLAKEEVEEWRESEYPGGMDHAGEFETSIYLALDPARVQMDKGTGRLPDPHQVALPRPHGRLAGEIRGPSQQDVTVTAPAAIPPSPPPGKANAFWMR